MVGCCSGAGESRQLGGGGAEDTGGVDGSGSSTRCPGCTPGRGPTQVSFLVFAGFFLPASRSMTLCFLTAIYPGGPGLAGARTSPF